MSFRCIKAYMLAFSGRFSRKCLEGLGINKINIRTLHPSQCPLNTQVISTEGALRLPTTYDKHPIQPNSIQHVWHIALNELNRPMIGLSQPSITFNDYQWLSMTTNHYQSLPITTNDYRWLLMTTDDYRWLLMTTNDYQWLPMTTDDYRRLPMTIDDYRWQPMTTDD